MPLSSEALRAVLAQETDEAFPLLLSIAHPDLDATIRVTNNAVAITSRGDEYIAYPFQITLPDQDPDQPVRVRLVIDNVARQVDEQNPESQSIIAGLRQLSGPPTITLEVVMASTPDVVESGPYEMTLRNAPFDVLTIEGDLAFEDLLNEPYPGDSFTPPLFPGLYP